MNPTPSPEHLQLLQQARQANLLKIWASGRRQLTAPELEEIRHLIPADPAEPDSMPTPAAFADGFQLEASGPAVRGSRVKYPRPLSEYAVLYDCDERTIKRMIERGRYQDAAKKKARDPLDLPPLHQPAAMPAWWNRRMQNRIPAGVLNAAGKGAASSSSPTSPAPSSPSTPPSETAPPLPIDFTKAVSLDLEGNVGELRISLARARYLLNLAQEANPPDEGLIGSRQRAFSSTFDLLRKAEGDLTDWKKARGELAPRDEVRAENNRIASAIYQAVLRLVKNVRPQLAGATPAQEDQIWQTETRACFAALKGAKFTTYELPL